MKKVIFLILLCWYLVVGANEIGYSSLNPILIDLNSEQQLSFSYLGNPNRWYKFNSIKSGNLRMNFVNKTSSNLKAYLYDNNFSEVSVMIINVDTINVYYENIKANHYYIKIEDTKKRTNTIGSLDFYFELISKNR